MAGPLLYSQLYVRGKASGVPSAPFVFNAAVTAVALVFGDVTLRAMRASSSSQWQILGKTNRPTK